MRELGDLKFETAQKNDVKELISLEKICFQEDAFSKRQISYLVTTAKGEFIVIRKNNNIIAYLIISKRENSKQIRIYSIAVAPKARGLGLAKKLLEYAEKITKEENKDYISLEVKETNQEAINLYLNVGYKKAGVRKNYYFDGANAIKMKKKIAALNS